MARPHTLRISCDQRCGAFCRISRRETMSGWREIPHAILQRRRPPARVWRRQLLSTGVKGRVLRWVRHSMPTALEFQQCELQKPGNLRRQPRSAHCKELWQISAERLLPLKTCRVAFGAWLRLPGTCLVRALQPGVPRGCQGTASTASTKTLCLSPGRLLRTERTQRTRKRSFLPLPPCRSPPSR